MTNEYSFRWGIPILDNGHIPVYRFMLRHYAEAGLTRDEFLCIEHLADYHYEHSEGKATPSLITVARHMGYGHSNSVRDLVKSLEAKKMLTVTRRPGKTSIYDFALFAEKAWQLWEKAHEEQPSQPTVIPVSQPSVIVPSRPSVTEEEEGKKKKQKKTAPRTPNPIFDAVCLGSFHITDSSKINGGGGRIGKIVKFVKAQGADVEKVQAFYAWYKEKYPDADAPRDDGKFSEHWLAFNQRQQSPSASPYQRFDGPPAHVMSDEERAAVQDRLKAARHVNAV